MNDADQSEALSDWREDVHGFLHYLAGHEVCMGSRVGPARVALPASEVSP